MTFRQGSVFGGVPYKEINSGAPLAEHMASLYVAQGTHALKISGRHIATTRNLKKRSTAEKC